MLTLHYCPTGMQTAVEAFGFSKEEAIGQVVSFLFPPERECDAQLFYSPR